MELRHSRVVVGTFSLFVALVPAADSSATPCSSQPDLRRMKWSKDLLSVVEITGCLPIETTGSAEAYTSAAVAEDKTMTGDQNGCCMSCSFFNGMFTRESDSGEELSNFFPMYVNAGSGMSGDCCYAGTYANAMGMVGGSFIQLRGSYGPAGSSQDACMSVIGSIHKCRAGCCDEAWFGHATPTARMNAELIAVFPTDSPCQPTATITVSDEKSLTVEDEEKAGADSRHVVVPRGDQTAKPMISCLTVDISWTRRDLSTESVVLQGVIADAFDGQTMSAIRLGLFDCPEFSGQLLTDGTPLLEEATFDVEAPHDDIAEVRILSFADSILSQNGDIDGDGVVCLEDLDLMLVLNDAVLGEVHDPLYTPRADFDLNGVIDDADQLAFAELFSALDDCNANGVPDECDIAYDVSSDTNLNGIPDECEHGDLNCDGTRNGLDVQAFVLALTEPDDYELVYETCDINRADLDNSGTVDTQDIPPFIALLLTSASE